eukprot:SAG31_NODE_10375_length_1146_cov_1.296084_1_plen_176_part_00
MHRILESTQHARAYPGTCTGSRIRIPGYAARLSMRMPDVWSGRPRIASALEVITTRLVRPTRSAVRFWWSQCEIMAIAMTAAQQQRWDEDGFIVFDQFLQRAELHRLLRAVEAVREAVGKADVEAFAVRNLVRHYILPLGLTPGCAVWQSVPAAAHISANANGCFDSAAVVGCSP